MLDNISIILSGTNDLNILNKECLIALINMGLNVKEKRTNKNFLSFTFDKEISLDNIYNFISMIEQTKLFKCESLVYDSNSEKFDEPPCAIIGIAYKKE